MTGHKTHAYREEPVVNIQAAELMGQLHDALKINGYGGHPLELLLVRFMFCLFADDTGIFEKGLFTYYIEERTRKDGADVGAACAYVFQLLNTPETERPIALDEDAAKFPYINGSLFDEMLPIATFDRKTRDILLKCCYFDWSNVSPAVFGSLVQVVVESQERRDFGVHYTSEKNVLKVIKPLFLDRLYAEFEARKRNKRALNELLGKIGSMKFLDPACGCGSFLVVAYKELRKLELEIHRQIQQLEGRGGKYRGTVLDVVEVFNQDINVDSFYGIDLFEFPARVAEVALWLTDHQANIELQNEFGLYYARLPLICAPHIIQGNALTLDWNSIVPKAELSYIFSNPPFVGKHYRSKIQNDDMEIVFSGKVQKYRSLDYVCSWYVKALEYVEGTAMEVAFVSTNSITQGEQVALLWGYLLAHGVRINFAHRPFKWSNLARGKAGVAVVIIAFALFDRAKKTTF
ncbi:MAG: DNA methyltransferase [Halobacteriota archaeon]